MNVGFIGIGSMGAAMVPNLVKAGHHVSVWNRNPDAAKALEGVTVLTSPAAAFENDAVITMLSDDAAIRSVIVDSDVLDSARKDCVHVVMATISPAIIAELQELHRSAGITYVAAPVLGIPAVAEKGKLNILAGPVMLRRSPRFSPYLRHWGKRPGISATIPSTPTSPRSPPI